MPIQVAPLAAEGKERVEAVLRRAAEDISFRELLLSDPNAALSETNLTEDEVAVLAGMRRVALEEWGVDVRSFRSFVLDNGNQVTLARDVQPV